MLARVLLLIATALGGLLWLCATLFVPWSLGDGSTSHLPTGWFIPPIVFVISLASCFLDRSELPPAAFLVSTGVAVSCWLFAPQEEEFGIIAAVLMLLYGLLWWAMFVERRKSGAR